MDTTYKLQKVLEDRFLIIGPDGKAIRNHLDNPYPVLSENISRNLCDDLNAINKKNRILIEKNKDNTDKEFELFHHEFLGNELRESLAYCVISTMMESSNNTFEIDLKTIIQWDRVYRLNPGPPKLLLELAILEKAKSLLNFEWVNLQLNYASSIEEMEAEEAEFVSEEIITELSNIVNEMTPVDRFICNLVYNFMDCFSITFPILWVAGKINEDYLVDVFWVFVNGENPEEIEEDAYEEVRFLKNRLLYLKAIKWGYSWNDETLPR